MANTLLDAQTNISNDTLREIVSESAFIGETPSVPVYTHATYGTLVGFVFHWLESDRNYNLFYRKQSAARG